jgi:hypothetical protein
MQFWTLLCVLNLTWNYYQNQSISEIPFLGGIRITIFYAIVNYLTHIRIDRKLH